MSTIVPSEHSEPIVHSVQEVYPLVVLYDGVCGLCNRTVQFVLKRDRRAKFRFAALQSEFASKLLARHDRDPAELNTLYLVLNANGSGEELFIKAGAVFRILRHLGGFWRAVAVVGYLPSGFLNRCYDFVASRRYRWFGRYESCPVPTREQRARFLD